MQAHLRAAYVLYSAAPCKKLDDLQKAIESVKQSEDELRTAEFQIGQLVALISTLHSASDPNLSTKVSDHLGQVLIELNRRAPAARLVEKMSRVSQNAKEWQQL